MHRIFAVLFLSIAALGQAAPLRIAPDVAAKHFIKTPKPEYPSAAELTRIQGNVILEVGIDESGNVTVRRLATGHPMLVQAAVQAVSRWKYEPPMADGKPTKAVTFVLVAFGDAAHYAAEGQTELAFQNDFWSGEDSAEAFMAKGDYAQAEDQLNKMKGFLSADKQEIRHKQEHWQWMTSMGRLLMSQKKYEESGKYFQDALTLRENKTEDKDSPEIAVSLANFAALLAEEKRFDLASEKASRALAIYQTNLKKAGNPQAQQAYGRAAANESRMLLKMAKERNEAAEAARQCHTLADLQKFLNAPENEAIASACHPEVSKPAQP